MSIVFDSYVNIPLFLQNDTWGHLAPVTNKVIRTLYTVKPVLTTTRYFHNFSLINSDFQIKAPLV